MIYSCRSLGGSLDLVYDIIETYQTEALKPCTRSLQAGGNKKTKIAGHQKQKTTLFLILIGTGRVPHAWNYFHHKRGATSHHQNHYLEASSNAA